MNCSVFLGTVVVRILFEFTFALFGAVTVRGGGMVVGAVRRPNTAAGGARGFDGTKKAEHG